MIGELKPYSAYKDSGVPWLEEIPKRWNTERAKWLFQKMDRPVRASDEVVTCFRDGTVTLRKNRRVQGFTESIKEIGYQGIRKGDLVIHGMDAFAGAIGVSDSEGKSTPVYSVCQPREGVDARFYSYVVREMARNQWILALAKGIRERSTDFRFSMFASLVVPFPPLEEQAAIAHYLNYADRRIRRYIRTKQRLIKLLEEQKQVVINEAVTSGLNPDISLQPSGIEWLGDIPTHWKVHRLRNILTDGPRNGISPPVAESGESVESFSISAIRDGVLDIRPSDVKHVASTHIPDLGKYNLKSGDVLLVRGNGNISFVGKAGLVEEDMLEQIYPDILMRLRFDSTIVPSYIISLLNCSASRVQVENAAKTTVGTYKVNNQQVRQLWIALPPYKEQISILKKIEHLTANISTCLLKAKSEIDLLREFRTRLIADVVTGKLDVREAAAKLPTDKTDSELSEADIAEDDIMTADDLDFDEPFEDEAA